MARALAFLACLFWAGAAMAEPAERAMMAAQALEAATRAMQAASTGRDQIAALTQTIQSYEEGMIALRDGLRSAQVQEAALAQQFAARGEDLARLLSVLMATNRLNDSLGYLHPSGALDAARAAMLLSEVAPGLARDVTALREALEDLRALRRARQFGLLALEQGLVAAQEARVALAQAISDRGPLPQNLTDAPAKLEALARNAATLSDFAIELADRPLVSESRTAITFRAAKGTLSPPVRATLLHRFNQSDAAGIARQGVVLATAPEALVTAPWQSTVRYAGPLAGHGVIVILEPGEEILLVLSGLGASFVQTGEILPPGAPVGTMPAVQSGEIASGSRSQTLYFEVREAGNPIDPEPWFAFSGA
ncbi:MAG: peptidoglycan DD-metalloendopeptidase family protein [Roseinatronobacter sp.]|nr:peptidoglycan DD-metalloendopeptidase family protein [Roseinatronobacter sp.]